jgi:hypothetical protein
MDVNGQIHALATLLQVRGSPVPIEEGGWVDSRIDLDEVAKKSLPQPRNKRHSHAYNQRFPHVNSAIISYVLRNAGRSLCTSYCKLLGEETVFYLVPITARCPCKC